MKIDSIPGGVTAAAGFRAACCAAGIKYQGRTDMAMLTSDAPCAVAGTFTSNVVKAAPVVWDREIVQNVKAARAVVVNAGIANAATGETGMALCRQTAEFTGKALDIPADQVLLGSTGVIGPNLPIDRITAGVAMMKQTLSDSLEAGTAASRAIMTTDTVNKECAVAFELPAADGKGAVKVHLGGMSKGSGMIHPNMCTMLAYVTTDCAIDSALLQQAVSDVVTDTFNMISVDGDTSTNDTLLVLANGAAGNAPVAAGSEAYDDLPRGAVHRLPDAGRQDGRGRRGRDPPDGDEGDGRRHQGTRPHAGPLGGGLQPGEGHDLRQGRQLRPHTLRAGLRRGGLRPRGDRAVPGGQGRHPLLLQGRLRAGLRRGQGPGDPLRKGDPLLLRHEDGQRGGHRLGLRFDL